MARYDAVEALFGVLGSGTESTITIQSWVGLGLKRTNVPMASQIVFGFLAGGGERITRELADLPVREGRAGEQDARLEGRLLRLHQGIVPALGPRVQPLFLALCMNIEPHAVTLRPVN